MSGCKCWDHDVEEGYRHGDNNEEVWIQTDERICCKE